MSPARVPNLTVGDLRRIFPVVTAAVEMTHGGQKQVFRATINGQTVALKLVLPDHEPAAPFVDAAASTIVPGEDSTLTMDDDGGGEDLDAEERMIPPRLRREVDLLATIDSPFIVPLIEMEGKRLRAIPDAGRWYLAYAEAWVDGEDLDHRLAKGTQQMPVPEVVRLALDCVAGITALWKNEIVHRDIKPHNIMRRSDGRFLLIDLGLALDIQAETITETGAWLGTMAFAAPEINDPELRDRVDFRADLFSLGLVLYEALAAFHPYQARTAGRTVTDVRRRMRDRPIPLIQRVTDAHPNLAAIIMRMINTDMNLRYARLSQLETALRTVAADLGVSP